LKKYNFNLKAMRTILVLTDFTTKDDHAAHYALRLAQKIKANILLCNVYPQIEASMAAGNSAYVNEIYDTLEEQSKNDLSELAGRLKSQLKNLTDSWFKPTIQQCSKGGPLTTAINEIVESRNVLMAVIAAHSNDDFLTFINVDHARQIIENANCPVLVLPYQVPFKGFNKIAFASDLDQHNADVLNSLCGMGKYFDSEILVTHVGNVPLGPVTENYILKRLIKQEPGETGCSIQYRSVQNKSVTEGLNWLAADTDIDLMVLVHHKRNFFQKLFEKSVTKKLADHLTKPMLVFPANRTRTALPVY
jgi:nucleotide-binding universal stress UspA family protein